MPHPTPVVREYQQALDHFRRAGRKPSLLKRMSELVSLLDLTTEGVLSLVSAGYLAAASNTPDELRFAIGDLKAFVARNADSGAGNLFGDEGEPADPQALLEALDGRSEEMARRAFDIFSAAFPEASSWGLKERARFIEQARNRFEAILAVTGQGEEVDEAGVRDLARERLAGFKVPRAVRFGALPKTSTGKIQKNVLRESEPGPAS